MMTQFDQAIASDQGCPDQVSTLNIRRQRTISWERFCRWVTSTDNRMYLGWFGVLMIPTLSTAAIVFVIALIAAPPVDVSLSGTEITC
jgi:photosystem II P680 reaction center D1 protein